MSARSKTSSPRISKAVRECICLRESRDGIMRCVSRGGPMNCPFGPAVVRASLSRLRASARELQTAGICGPNSTDLSASAVLQLSLESRLAANLDVNGSLEYALTWKNLGIALPSRICQLAAGERPTGDRGCTGWPTCMGTDASKAPKKFAGGNLSLPETAKMEGWPTPQSLSFDQSHQPGNNRAENKVKEMFAGWPTVQQRDWKGPQGRAYKGESDDLPSVADQVETVPWGTPSTRDWKDGDCSNAEVPENSLLGRQVIGLTTQSSGAETPKAVPPSRGALNPAHSRWLMGFPPEWDEYAVTETPSSPRSRRSSSDPTWKRSESGPQTECAPEPEPEWEL